ncbi:TPA: hypothetical protein KTE99_003488 [Escherichia coli]|nr:hypothetical protein [Escherichia coli]
MRKFKVIIETGIAGGDFEDVFEVDDDATPDEIHDCMRKMTLKILSRR